MKRQLLALSLFLGLISFGWAAFAVADKPATDSTERFHRLRRERIERYLLSALQQNDVDVGRFARRTGNGIYMASIETDDVPQIEERVSSSGPGWQGTRFGGFIHPRRTHGLLIGLVTYENWIRTRPLPESA